MAAPPHPVPRAAGAPSATSSAAPMWPAYALRSLGCSSPWRRVLFLLGGLVQINPIWQWGPYQPWLGTNGAQPDWYMGWLIGALRLMPELRAAARSATRSPTRSSAASLFPRVDVRRAVRVAVDRARASAATGARTTCSTGRATTRGARRSAPRSSPGCWCRSSPARPTASSSASTSPTSARSRCCGCCGWLLPPVVFAVTLHWMRGASRRRWSPRGPAPRLAGTGVAAHELGPRSERGLLPAGRRSRSAARRRAPRPSPADPRRHAPPPARHRAAGTLPGRPRRSWSCRSRSRRPSRLECPPRTTPKPID